MFQGRKAGDLTKKPTKSMVIFHKRKYGDFTKDLWGFDHQTMAISSPGLLGIDLRHHGGQNWNLDPWTPASFLGSKTGAICAYSDLGVI
jgi:hypothetical protein